MVQSRIYDWGALLTQGRTKTLASSLFTPGVYEGFEPTVISATLIELSPGTILLPNGVLVQESDVTQVTVATPVGAEDYTVTIDHDDIQAVGGSSAYYTLRSGLLGRSADPNTSSVALLWVRHPGSTPLTDDMLSRPPTLQAGAISPAVDGFVPAPFSAACDVVKGSNITATQKSYTVQYGSTTATLGAPSGGAITVTGLAGMTADSVGRYLSLSGATAPLNNSQFRIVTYNSATSVDITDNGTAPGSDTASWNEIEPSVLGVQIVNSAVSGLQTYQFRLPLPDRPLPRQIDVFGYIPPLGVVSFDTIPYESFLLDGTVIGMTPSTVSGEADGVDLGGTPAASFVLDNYDSAVPPASLGVTITVPPNTRGVFLRGLNLTGD
jgi:hypothetical protein